MSNPKRILKNLNRYSWLLIVALIFASIAMQYHTTQITFEGFYLSLPLVSLMVYWSEQMVCLVRLKNCQLTKQESFNRDLFMINYSFLLAGLLSLLFQYSNSDARGWWPLFLYFNSLEGFIFSLLFSLIALMLPPHKNYTITFTSVIMLFITFSKFWPYTISFLFIEKIEFYYAVIFSLFIIHVLSVFVYKSYKMLLKKTFN